MRSRRAMSRPPRADARSAWSSRPRPGLRLLLPQSRQPPAGDVLEALAELLLRLDQRRARQDEHGVLLFHAGRDLNVVLIGQARLDRRRRDVAGAAHEHDIAVSGSSPGASRAPAAPAPTGTLRSAEHLGKQRSLGSGRLGAAPHLGYRLLYLIGCHPRWERDHPAVRSGERSGCLCLRGGVGRRVARAALRSGRRGRRGDLLLDQLGVESENRRAGGHVARGPERGVRHREHTVAPSGVNPYLRIHPGLEEVSWVRDVHEHREARDVLHDLRLRADLQHGAVEGAVRERIHCDRYKASLRLSCAVAVSSCARALSSAACAWARFCWGMRGSIRANSWPFCISSPVWTGISMISPHALDLTMNVRIGCTTPDALAVTTMSRRATGTAS